MVKIIFDGTCTSWTCDSTRNTFFLLRQREYIMELFLHREYIYLNTIYEILGAKWNPDNENRCWRTGDIFEIEFSEPDPQGTILITIT